MRAFFSDGFLPTATSIDVRRVAELLRLDTHIRLLSDAVEKFSGPQARDDGLVRISGGCGLGLKGGQQLAAGREPPEECRRPRSGATSVFGRSSQ